MIVTAIVMKSDTEAYFLALFLLVCFLQIFFILQITSILDDTHFHCINFFITKTKPTLSTVLVRRILAQSKEASTLRYYYH
jgi:hypothetical protein